MLADVVIAAEKSQLPVLLLEELPLTFKDHAMQLPPPGPSRSLLDYFSSQQLTQSSYCTGKVLFLFFSKALEGEH